MQLKEKCFIKRLQFEFIFHQPAADINNTINGSDEVKSVESKLPDSIMYGSDEVRSVESKRPDSIMYGSDEVD